MFIHRIGLSVRIVPPLGGIGAEARSRHGAFQQAGVCGGSISDVTVIPVCQSGEIIKVCGHVHGLTVGGDQRHVNGVSPTVRGKALFRVCHISGIRTDLPEPELRGSRAEGVPDQQGTAAFLNGLLVPAASFCTVPYRR